MKGKMTTSRIGIMGSFLDSYFSFAVVTESPGVTTAEPTSFDFTWPQRSGEMAIPW
jgi:hypothetical protein